MLARRAGGVQVLAAAGVPKAKVLRVCNVRGQRARRTHEHEELYGAASPHPGSLINLHRDCMQEGWLLASRTAFFRAQDTAKRRLAMMARSGLEVAQANSG